MIKSRKDWKRGRIIRNSIMLQGALPFHKGKHLVITRRSENYGVEKGDVPRISWRGER